MAKLFIISGPTASGKTSSSILLAKLVNAEIVNFDSLLFYRELTIGTAKPTLEEMEGIPHHLIDISSLKDPLNASAYILMAEQKIEELLSRGTNVILVGGSGFYLRALIKGMYDDTKTSQELRIEVEQKYKKEGITPFIDFLKENDPKTVKTLHENDHYRLMRAYEYFRSTSSPISSQKELLDKNDPYDFSKNQHPGWNITHIFLDLPKDDHYQIIQKRTNQMIESGLVEEVKELIAQGFSIKNKPLQSIGYKETIGFIEGNFSSEQDYIERISISTRQLAKSQRTFFKKITPKLEFNSHEFIDHLKKGDLSFL